MFEALKARAGAELPHIECVSEVTPGLEALRRQVASGSAASAERGVFRLLGGAEVGHFHPNWIDRRDEDVLDEYSSAGIRNEG